MNNVSLIGRLVADPEVKHSKNGIAEIPFTIAVNRKYVKQGEERQADFIDCVAWRSTAEFIGRYFKKGQMIALTGEINTRIYEDKEGNRRKAVEVVVANAYFCEPKKEVQLPAGYGNEVVIADDEDLPF